MTDGGPLFDEAQLARATARWEREAAERKALERPYTFPGLDVEWWWNRPPTRVWMHRGVYAAINPSPGYVGPSFNGYVLLPPHHPWRELDLQMGDYEAGPQVHGGITFGPHVTGWIGFDTGHAGDFWEKEEVVRAKEDGYIDEERWEGWLYHAARGAEAGIDDYWENPLGRGAPWARGWTMPQLLEETNDLAAQVAASTPKKETS